MPSLKLYDAALDVRLRLIVESYRRLTGKELVPSVGAMWNAPFAIVAHGTETDPVFFYGNEYALRCFEMDFDEFTCLPSRLSAEVVVQESREKVLRKVAEQGYIDGYSGMRIAKSGRRFMIADCTIWNLADAAGVLQGQAAVFITQKPDKL